MDLKSSSSNLQPKIMFWFPDAKIDISYKIGHGGATDTGHIIVLLAATDCAQCPKYYDAYAITWNVKSKLICASFSYHNSPSEHSKCFGVMENPLALFLCRLFQIMPVKGLGSTAVWLALHKQLAELFSDTHLLNRALLEVKLKGRM